MERPTMQKILRLLCLFLSLSLALIFASQAYAQDKHFLWHVQFKGKSAFILGSVHVMKKEHYPLGRMIDNAFNQSEALAVEFNITALDPDALQRLSSAAFYRGDDSLDQHVSPQTLELVKKKTDEMGLNFDFIRRQKPWLLVSTLPAVALLRAGYEPQYGIDMYLLNRAGGTKKIIEIESLDFQIKLMAGFSEAEQELLLLYTLKELNLAVQEADDLIEAWKTGNVQKIEAITMKTFKEDARLEPISLKLLDDRNKRMAERIEAVKKVQENCFFVVGAAHLVGDKVLIQLLQKKGMVVKQL
jgi:uncharacterized protein